MQKNKPHVLFGHWTFLAFLLSTVSAAGTPHSAGAQPAALDTLFAPTPCAFCGFGFDLDAGTSVGGTPRMIALERDRPPDGAAYPFAYVDVSSEWVIEDSLGNENPNGGLGSTVAYASGTDLPLVMVSDAGAVALWRREATQGFWVLEALLEGIIKPGEGIPQFGSSFSGTYLSSGEELLFIGARNGGDDGGAVREGSAYAFVRAAGTPPGPNAWTMEARILAPDGGEGDRFGTAVALLPTPGLTGGNPGDALVIVGADERPPPPMGQDGVVYVYRRDGATGAWAFETTFIPSDLDHFDYFGSAVDLLALPDGVPGEALAIIGAFGDGDLGSGTGAAYAFRREYVAAADTFRWVEETKFLPAMPVQGLQFGAAVALAADTLAGGFPVALGLVGANPEFGTGGLGHPSEADLFMRSTVSGQPEWTRRATYATGAQSQTADWFGHSVAFAPTATGPLALVGAYYSDAALEQGDPNGTAAGAVFIYDASVVVAEEAGLPTPQDGLSLSVFPNPARGEVQIRLRLPAPEHIRVALYDVLGREVTVVFEGEVAGNHTLQLDTLPLAAGVYVVRTESDGRTTSRTFSVVR